MRYSIYTLRTFVLVLVLILFTAILAVPETFKIWLILFFLRGYPVLVWVTFTVGAMIIMILAVALVTDDPLYPPRRGPYIAAILPPLLWLLAPFMLPDMKGALFDQLEILYDVLINRIEDWFILPFFLLFLVFTVFVFVGVKGGQAYKDMIKPRRSAWFVFGLGIMFVIWFVPKTLINVQAKIVGMHVDVMFDVGEAIRDINTAAAYLRDKADGNDFKFALLKQTEALESSLNLLQESLWTGSVALAEASRDADKMAEAVAAAIVQDLTIDSAPGIDDRLQKATLSADEAHKSVGLISSTASAAGVENIAKMADAFQKQLENEISLNIKAARQKVQALAAADKEDEAAVKKAVEEAQNALKALQKTMGIASGASEGSVIHNVNMLAKMAAVKGMNSDFEEQTQRSILRATAQMLVLVRDIKEQAAHLEIKTTENINLQQSWRINEVQDKARALELAGKALRIDIGTPMLMVALLFIVFLLMPWLLYISFIVRKREKIVNDRLDLLSDLNLVKGFRSSAKPSTDLTIEGANIARELIEMKGGVDIESRFGQQRVTLLKDASLAFNKIVELMQPQEDGRITHPAEAEKKEIVRLADIETLKRQTFNDHEYLIPLIILSVLSLVGWYYTIFATGSNSLVRFIEQGGSSVQLTELLSQFTPFTMVFAGAWLFMIVMLTYRWVNNDLYPGSYHYASMRLVYGLLVGMVFLALFGKDTNWFFLAMAFLVGIAPLELVYALWGYLKDFAGDKAHEYQIMKYFPRPKLFSNQPLTVLEDLTVWDDTRLWQEGIQNVHALATADLARLAVHTPYDAQTLVDWVDQAVLHIHTKALWQAGFAAIGIRGATDLFDAGGYEKGKFNEEKLGCIVDAFNAAHLLSIDTADPRLEAHSEAVALETAGNALEKATKTVNSALEGLDPAKDETLDKIIALRNQVNGLKMAADKAMQARRQANDVLVTHGANQDIVDLWADGGEIDRQLKALAEGSGSLIIKAENAVTENRLTSKMLEDDLTKAVENDKPGQAALQAAQEAVKALVGPAEKAKKASERAFPEPARVTSAAGPIKDKVDALHGKIETLVKQTAAAKTQSEKLTQANAGELTMKPKIPTDANAIAAASKAVNDIAAASGADQSIADKTIAGMMTDISEPFKHVAAKLEMAVASVTALARAAGRANTLAQSIQTGDDTTWDTVKALAEELSKLKTAVKITETACTQMSKKLEESKAQQATALLEVRKILKELAIDDARNKTEAAEKAFRNKAGKIALSAGSKDGLDEAIQKVKPAVAAAIALASGAGEVAKGAIRAVLPFRLTIQILKVMLGSMETDPNIHYVRHFWKEQAIKANAAGDTSAHDTVERAYKAVSQTNVISPR